MLFCSISVRGITPADLATGQINWSVALNTGIESLSEQKMEVACNLGSDTTNIKTKKQWTKTDTELVKQTVSKWIHQKFKVYVMFLPLSCGPCLLILVYR